MPLIQANGVTLHYELAGPAAAPVVVFSNSIGTTLEMWDAQVAALSGRYRCLRYDTRGHGRSPVIDAPVDVRGLARDLRGLLDALEIPRAHVVGLSLGGMTAQALAIDEPDRVDRLVLMATAACLPPPEGWRQRAALVRARGMAAIADAVIPRWFTPSFQRTHPAAVAAVLERFIRTAPTGYAACCDAIAALDLRPQLGRITAPTLVIAGADDPATPVSLLEELRAGIPGADLLILPQAAHLLAIEQAASVNHRLADFLAAPPR